MSINMNLQEHIRKVLKEETDHLRMMLRRLPSKTVKKMDEEFDSSLNYISKMFIKTYKSDPRKLSEHEFTRMVIIDLMSLLDVRNHLPNDVEWYDDVLNGLSKHYKKRITSMYNVLKMKHYDDNCGSGSIPLKESIRKVLKEKRKLSSFLLRRLDMLDYEVENNWAPFAGSNICIFFKSDIEFFETIMENSIDAMYYNYFSHIDDNSGEWAHEYLDMVDYIRKKYQYKIMKHYDDNCGSGSIPLKESIRRVLREETNVPLSFRRRITNSDIEEEFLKALDSIDYSRLHNQFSPIKNISLKTFAKLVIDEMYMYLEKDYFSDEDSILFDNDEIYHEKIRVPLINYFGDRIKKRYNGNKINESVDKSKDKKD